MDSKNIVWITLKHESYQGYDYVSGQLLWLTRIFHELLSRDREDGRATGKPSRGTAGLVRGVPERYVAGADTRGRPEGRPYPWSQQVIHKMSGLAPAVATPTL